MRREGDGERGSGQKVTGAKGGYARRGRTIEPRNSAEIDFSP